MANLIRFALSQRLLMMILVLLLAGAGFHAFTHIPIDAFPEVSPTQVKIIVKAPGMTPEEVEARITAPIEIELLGIPHQTMLRSIAKYALTDITVDFAEGTDIYWARQQIAERLNTMWGNLPAGVEGGVLPDFVSAPDQAENRQCRLGNTVSVERHARGDVGRILAEERLGQRINGERVKMAQATGAPLLVSNCPFCLTMFEDGIKTGDSVGQLQARDLAEIVAERIAV